MHAGMAKAIFDRLTRKALVELLATKTFLLCCSDDVTVRNNAAALS